MDGRVAKVSDRSGPGRLGGGAVKLVLAMCLTWLAPACTALAYGSCVVSVLNQSANVQGNGTWRLPNVPTNGGRVRARVTCVEDGVTRSGASEFMAVVPNRMNAIPIVNMDAAPATPLRISVEAPTATLTTAGSTLQLQVVATFADSTTSDVSAADSGTTYQSTNPGVAIVSPDGLVSAVASGRLLIVVLHESIVDTFPVSVVVGEDADGDGMPDDWELENGLDPSDPADGFEDPDSDGLRNAGEFEAGTNLRDPDSDTDDILDGEETRIGADGYVTNPLLADTDGDSVADALEIELGTDPTDPNSVDIGRALESVHVVPGSVHLYVNTILPQEVSAQLHVTGLLFDGRVIELTNRLDTEYESSDLAILNFGAERGRVYAGQGGTATLTVTSHGVSASATVEVTSTSPVALASIALPCDAGDVAVRGQFAYVACGLAGVVVVEVTDPAHPAVATTVDTPGYAKSIVVSNHYAYVADGPAGLSVLSIAMPRQPTLVSTLSTGAPTRDVALKAAHAFLAQGNGLAVVDVSDPAAPALVHLEPLTGGALGVAIAGDMAVVARNTAGVTVFDVADPSAPVLGGTTHTRPNQQSSAYDVTIRDGKAYVADGAGWSRNGVSAIDLSSAETAVVARTTSTLAVRGVAIDGALGFLADGFAFASVPIVDIEAADLSVLGSLSFASFSGFMGTSVAVQDGLVYRAAVDMWDTGGPSRLDIGRYAFFGDQGAVVPTIDIVSPSPGAEWGERTTQEVVTSVSSPSGSRAVVVRQNGQVASAGPRRTHRVRVPPGIGALELDAAVTDYAGNTADCPAIDVLVVPNQDPTVEWLSPPGGASVTEGATVAFAARVTDDSLAPPSVVFTIDGASVGTKATPPYVLLATVPTGGGIDRTLQAVATDDDSNVVASEPVVVHVQEDQPPSIAILSPQSGTALVGEHMMIACAVDDDMGMASVRLLIDGVLTETKTTEPFTFVATLPGAGPVVLRAVAVDSAGHETSSNEVTLSLDADPLTTVVGHVVDEEGVPVAAAEVSVSFELDGSTTASVQTDSNGAFELVGVPTRFGRLTINASKDHDAGASEPTPPARGGTTSGGTIVIAPMAGGTGVT